jgi:DNA-binding XRE family transcriptional regulator
MKILRLKQIFHGRFNDNFLLSTYRISPIDFLHSGCLYYHFLHQPFRSNRFCLISKGKHPTLDPLRNIRSSPAQKFKFYFKGFFFYYSNKLGIITSQDTENSYLVNYSLHKRYFYAIRLNMNNNNVESLLLKLGERLKEARLARNESQELFAQRLGLTRQSYSKMEKGSPQTLIGNWLEASIILGRLSDWKDLLAEKEDLFAKFEKKSVRRQRAGGRRKRKK